MRKDVRKSQKSIVPNRTTFRDNPERKETLRGKFVNKAISYLGVPYGKRYLTEDNPLYFSPIFLDCCGLVRQCINDLSEEFGFKLFRWNQAYQMDVLPDKIEFENLKPGDLIFYEAIYYPEKGWKQQPHNLVHVEIYLGGQDTPERTIGSRNRYGVVEYNDTYQFTSENYYDIKYHFKSIDSWLKGIHKSVCEEHRWHEMNIENKQNKFSLFEEDDLINDSIYEFAQEMKI
jgi:hypothetical protein